MARGPVRQCANTLNQKSCNRWSLCQRLPPPHPLHSLPQHLHQTTPPSLLMTTRSSLLLSVTSSLVLIFKAANRFLVVNYLDLADTVVHFSSSPCIQPLVLSQIYCSIEKLQRQRKRYKLEISVKISVLEYTELIKVFFYKISVCRQRWK